MEKNKNLGGNSMKKTENVFNTLIPTEPSSCDEMNIIFHTPVTVQMTQTIVPESFTKISNEMIEKYINNIQNTIKSNIYEESSLGLVAYIENEKLRESIKVIVVSVEEYNNNLYGVASIIPKRQLTDKEIDCLKDYLEGQYADSWGESFEQQYIQVKEKNKYYTNKIKIKHLSITYLQCLLGVFSIIF